MITVAISGASIEAHVRSYMGHAVSVRLSGVGRVRVNVRVRVRFWG